MGTKNPFRYRGYYYDVETGLYYLQSRYYDPEIGRFINADGQLNTGAGMTGYNPFCYGGNNPIMRVDPTGHAWWHWAIAATVVAVCAVATVVTCGMSISGAALAIGMLTNGMASATTALTVTAGAFIVSATVCGLAAITEAETSSSVSEFNSKGNWGTVAATAGGAVFAGVNAYASTRSLVPNQSSNKPNSQNNNPIKYPGNNPSECDIPGFEWRGSGIPGSGKGNFVNMGSGEWLHPDLNHGPPIGPHWDYGTRGNPQTFRIFPDDTILPK